MCVGHVDTPKPIVLVLHRSAMYSLVKNMPIGDPSVDNMQVYFTSSWNLP